MFSPARSGWRRVYRTTCQKKRRPNCVVMRDCSPSRGWLVGKLHGDLSLTNGPRPPGAHPAFASGRANKLFSNRCPIPPPPSDRPAPPCRPRTIGAPRTRTRSTAAGLRAQEESPADRQPRRAFPGVLELRGAFAERGDVRRRNRGLWPRGSSVATAWISASTGWAPASTSKRCSIHLERDRPDGPRRGARRGLAAHRPRARPARADLCRWRAAWSGCPKPCAGSSTATATSPPVTCPRWRWKWWKSPRRQPELRVSQEVGMWLECRRREAEALALRRTYEHNVQSGIWPAQETLLPLFPYQREGMLHLVCAERALLADEMGLGKTAPGRRGVRAPAPARARGTRAGGDACLPARRMGGANPPFHPPVAANPGRQPRRTSRRLRTRHRAVFHGGQLRRDAHRFAGGQRTAQARSRHPRRGAAHQELEHQDRHGRQTPAQPLRLGADRHAAGKPHRRTVFARQFPRPGDLRAACSASTGSFTTSTNAAVRAATATSKRSASASARSSCAAARRTWKRSCPTASSARSWCR